VMGSGKMVVRSTLGGIPVWTRDATANDSDKTFTVPANKRWRLLSIWAQIDCTATAGNRVLGATIGNGADVIFPVIYTGSITASQQGVIKSFIALTASTTPQYAPKLNQDAANVVAINALPELWLPAGHTIRVWDRGAIDAAADDMTVILHYEELDV